MNTFKKHQRGSSLIEILASLVILGIGILGVAALQTASLKSNQSAFLRTQANLLGSDMLERIRANRQGLNAGDYDEPVPVLTASCITASGCTASQLAANDVLEWQTLVEASLPSGKAMVCLDSGDYDGTWEAQACSGSDYYAIKIWWDDDRDGARDQRIVMSMQP